MLKTKITETLNYPIKQDSRKFTINEGKSPHFRQKHKIYDSILRYAKITHLIKQLAFFFKRKIINKECD